MNIRNSIFLAYRSREKKQMKIDRKNTRWKKKLRKREQMEQLKH